MKASAYRETIRMPVILFAGLCGGLAEVVWIQIYATLTGHSSVEVARQVTASVLPGMADAALAPGLGLLIHFALSLLVTLGYTTFVWKPFLRHRGPAAAIAVAAGALASCPDRGPTRSAAGAPRALAHGTCDVPWTGPRNPTHIKKM